MGKWKAFCMKCGESALNDVWAEETFAQKRSMWWKRFRYPVAIQQTCNMADLFFLGLIGSDMVETVET